MGNAGICFYSRLVLRVIHRGYKQTSLISAEPTAMPTKKKSNSKKPKQANAKSGSKGGSMDYDVGSPKPIRKPKKKK
jgi:hypothetical protein